MGIELSWALIRFIGSIRVNEIRVRVRNFRVQAKPGLGQRLLLVI